MEISLAITATARLLVADTIAMDLSRRLQKAKYLKMHQQDWCSLQSQRKHNLIWRKLKVMSTHLATHEMIKLRSHRTLVIHGMILRLVVRHQQTQKLRLSEFEMNGVSLLILDQISGPNQNTKVKESNILNRKRELIYVEILVTKNIAGQSLLPSRRERNSTDQLKSESRNLLRSMTYYLSMTIWESG
jgi:hypothetical protein